MDLSTAFEPIGSKVFSNELKNSVRYPGRYPGARTSQRFSIASVL